MRIDVISSKCQRAGRVQIDTDVAESSRALGRHVARCSPRDLSPGSGRVIGADDSQQRHQTNIV